MIIITASVVSTVICLRFHHTVGDDAKHMPNWVRSDVPDNIYRLDLGASDFYGFPTASSMHATM